jgi:hypothetical protein
MKKFTLLLLMWGLILSSCAIDHGASSGREASFIKIDFQTYFENSHVSLYVDGKREFDGFVTTIDVLGYTGVSVDVALINKNNSYVMLKIVVNGMQYERRLDVSRGNYVGIEFDPNSGEFSYRQSTERFYYE